MKEIEFFPTSKGAELFVPPPKPAKLYIPEWYKKMRVTDGKPVIQEGRVTNKTVKSCMAFFDAITAGYIQETWCDIYISINNGLLEYQYSHGPEIIKGEPRNPRSLGSVVPDRFAPFEFTWQMPWMPKASDGYSCLFTHPLNNFSLPFITTSGIVDSDLFYSGVIGNYPFYLYEGFSGTIPCGTPMYQIIPIKREKWESKAGKYDEERSQKKFYQMKKTFLGAYKRMFHVKKYYD